MNIPKEEPPPILRTWRRVYIAIGVYLATIIALFYAFERAFS